MFTQWYTPIAGSVGWSALVAVIPILYFFVALVGLRMRAHVAALSTVILAILDAWIVFRFPLDKAVSASIYGMFTGLWPIGWIVFAAVFLYRITVNTGFFDVIRQSISGLSEDRRIQALLIAFSFGAFLEGTAGFGTPVAVAAAMLAGLGFNPMYAAGICLLANTAPVAFGAVGIPITAMATATGSSPLLISQMVGRILPFASLIVPFWLMVVMSGWRGMREVFPAALTCGLSFAITQFVVSNFVGPELPDILAAIVSILCLMILLRFWQPKTVWRFPDEPLSTLHPGQPTRTSRPRAGEIFRAWSPFLVLCLFIILWAIPAVKNVLSHATVLVSWPDLHLKVAEAAPIVNKAAPLAAQWKLDILGATGTSILLAAVVAKFILGQSWANWFRTLGETFRSLIYPLLTIAFVVGFGYLFNYSGMAATIAMALAATGALFPFFAPFLGWLGVFLTGSDTSSDLLFGNLQKLTALQLGLNPYLTMGANSAGGVMGKMISPQSIAVGTSATGLVGHEGDLYRFTLKHSVALVLFVAIITTVYAYVFPNAIPH
ncbi:MAG: lactate permease LctP family transporter [Alicyclobacillus herbarius]|uniref:L-lactate permease n=1 Tax=Alicyclobacillus herbarius TaxID=122960 RepID=UPI0023551A09|nr:lactate permease LctP family transporter [Alicyclobacillus herbarius]MCL6633287.1 lactate permease LctP family transporter [Alicyclobacillus herbarius]